MAVKIDIFIPTLNEAGHITQAVANGRLLGDVYVLDSFSTDGTQQLARDAGATVVEHRFVDYAAQKNWGLDNLPFTGEWVFILDADERITPALKQEIEQRLATQPHNNGYFVNRVVLFMGKPIWYGGFYPAWNLRLFRRGQARYEQRAVHEHMVCADPVDYLKHPMLHLRHETMSRFIAKHIQYADLESEEWVKWYFDRSSAASAERLFKRALQVRQWIRRQLWPRMPLRPLWRFIYMYIFRFGILDGRPGWHLARLISCYEYMISAMYREKLERRRQRKAP